MFFSIIVPVFNRERFIDRCLRSVFSQSFTDYEIIAVDDGSTDDSAARIARYDDPRLKLLRHPRNLGVQPARQTAFAQAAGTWHVMLDSDDELVDGALQVMHDRLCGLRPPVFAASFSCRMDDGTITPHDVVDEIRDYRKYLAFMEQRVPFGHSTDALECLHRDCPALDLPSERKGFEDLYLLEYHRYFQTSAFSDVLRLYHQDADNQLVKTAAGDPRRDEQLARDRIAVLEAMFDRHGADLRALAPRTHHLYASRLAVLHFLVGDRRRGLHYSWVGLRSRPASLRSWAVPVLGMAGKSVLQKARASGRSAPRG